MCSHSHLSATLFGEDYRGSELCQQAVPLCHETVSLGRHLKAGRKVSRADKQLMCVLEKSTVIIQGKEDWKGQPTMRRHEKDKNSKKT